MLTEASYLVANAAGLMLGQRWAVMHHGHEAAGDAAPTMAMRLVGGAESSALWLGATRYYLGRPTYAVAEFVALLIRNWPALPQVTRGLIQRDVEDAADRDDDARLARSKHLPLGQACDREQWKRVRALWGGGAMEG